MLTIISAVLLLAAGTIGVYCGGYCIIAGIIALVGLLGLKKN